MDAEGYTYYYDDDWCEEWPNEMVEDQTAETEESKEIVEVVAPGAEASEVAASSSAAPEVWYANDSWDSWCYPTSSQFAPVYSFFICARKSTSQSVFRAHEKTHIFARAQ